MKNILRMVLQNIIKTSKEKSWLPEKAGLHSKNWTKDRIIKKKVGLNCFLLICCKIKHLGICFCKTEQYVLLMG